MYMYINIYKCPIYNIIIRKYSLTQSKSSVFVCHVPWPDAWITRTRKNTAALAPTTYKIMNSIKVQNPRRIIELYIGTLPPV